MEHDTKSKGWSSSGETHSGNHGAARRLLVRRARLRTLALAVALCLLAAGRAHAIHVSSARIAFGASAPDRVKLQGDLQMPLQAIEAFPSIRIDIGTFSETISTSDLEQRITSDGTPTHKYVYKMPSERRRLRATGIYSLVVDLDRSRFTVDARYLALKRATNPLPFRFVGGLFDQCNMLPFHERPALRGFIVTDPDTGETTINWVNDATRHSSWSFSRDALQPSCAIKDFRADHKGFSVNQPTKVRFEARIPNSSVGLVQVFAVDSYLEISAGPLCDLQDGGVNGDDVRDDRVYSCAFEFFEETPTSIRLIAKGVVGGADAISPQVEMDVVPQLIEQDAAVFIDDLYHAREIWGDHLSSLGNTAEARQQTAASIRALPFVRDLAFDTEGFLIEFAVEDRPGILGYLPALGYEPRHAQLFPGIDSPSLPVEPVHTPATFSLYENVNTGLFAQAASIEPNDAVPSTKVLLWAPFYGQFFPNDDLNDLRHRYATTECPSFDVRLLRDDECTLASVRRFADYGTLILATEGKYPHSPLILDRDKIFDQAPFFATGERVSAAAATLEIVNLYIRDRMASYGVPNVPERKSPRLVLFFSDSRGVVWGVRPEFIDELPARYPESVVFAGWHLSSRSFKMAQSFTNAGARSFFGFTGEASESFIRTEIQDLFGRMLDGQSALASYASLPTIYDAQSEAVLTIAGDGRSTYRGLEDLLNGNFETGTLKSWDSGGDARVVSRLGPYVQRDGAFMGLISTGLGATHAGGAIGQTTCIPPGRHRLLFDWNFLSEEFKNYCGYDDAFVVTVNGTTAFRRSVNGLCASNLTRLTDLTFDAGDDVWATGWQSADIDLAPFQGDRRTVSLNFATSDRGDSAYDTAILVDRVRFE